MPQDGYQFFLKNAGGAALALKLAVSSTPMNPDKVDLTKVHVILTPLDGGSVQNFTLQSLIASSTTGGIAISSPSELLPNLSDKYTLQVSMEADAVDGPSATISNLDFNFLGAAIGG